MNTNIIKTRIMKKKVIISFFVFCAMQTMMAQITSLGLVEESHIPQETSYPFLYYTPQMSFVGDKLYAATPKGLYTRKVSGNMGEWEHLPITNGLVVDFAVHGDTLAVLTRDTLYLSADSGASYDRIPAGAFITNNPDGTKKLRHISFHPHNAQRIYVAYGGAAYSPDFGKTWEKLPNSIQMEGASLSFAPVKVLFNPNAPTHIVSYGNYPAYNSSSVMQSCDNGYNWTLSYNNSSVSEIHSVAFHPTDTNKLIICGVGTYLMQDQQGQRLENITKPDSKKHELLVNLFDVVYDTRTPNILYGADMSTALKKNVVILRSIDGGLTWEDFYAIECESADYASKLAIKDNLLAIYTNANGIYLLDVDAVEVSVPSIETNPTASPYYDLMGRPVAHPTRGIYIKEGKKVVIGK